MRVLVAADAAGDLSALQAGEAIAEGWQRGSPAAELAVVGLAEAGRDFVRAVAEACGGELGLIELPPAVPDLMALGVAGSDVACLALESTGAQHAAAPPALAERAGTEAWGYALGELLAAANPRPETVLIDLSGVAALDAGAGFLAAFGGVEDPADGLRRARARLDGVRLVGVLARDETGRLLSGLRGMVSLAAQAERERGGAPDPARLLALDAAAVAFAAALAAQTPGRLGAELAATPGAGAGGGIGLVVRALGGRLVSGPEWFAERFALPGSLGAADLVITSTGRYDFASRGGGVVQSVADWAREAMRPCIVLAGEVVIGGREQRTMGVEAAYSVYDAGVPGSAPAVRARDLSELAARIAHSWSW